MRTAGHTIQQARKVHTGGRWVDRTLECSCGRVFASARCTVEDETKAAEAVFTEGYEAAGLHIARCDEVWRTLMGERPCAA